MWYISIDAMFNTNFDNQIFIHCMLSIAIFIIP